MRNYEVFSTTADTGIRFKGRDFSQLYENALRGLNLLLFGVNLRKARGDESVRFSFQGDGPENVLVNFLSAILSLAYQGEKRVAAIEIDCADRFALNVKLWLAACRTTPRMEIKAVTYHNLRVVEQNGALRAAIVFDI
jgi:SHS2 domain-containing protein